MAEASPREAVSPTVETDVPDKKSLDMQRGISEEKNSLPVKAQFGDVQGPASNDYDGSFLPVSIKPDVTSYKAGTAVQCAYIYTVCNCTCMCVCANALCVRFVCLYVCVCDREQIMKCF